MLSFLVAVILLMIAALAVTLRKVYAAVPPAELKRQAAAGDQAARELWKVVAYGRSLRVLLWLVMAFFAAWSLVLLTAALPSVSTILAGMAVLWLLFSWLPGTRISATAVKFAHTVNPAMVWLLQRLDPILHAVEKPFLRHYVPRHSELYELDDLFDLLDAQAVQSDNRITAAQLAAVRATLEFNDRKVRDVVRLHAKTVALTDAIGPILLDELHADGQQAFPVTKTPRSHEIVGCVFLNDLSIKSEGTVADYASMGVLTVREQAPLHEVLASFLSSKHQLAVVVDKADEFVGVLTLKDVMTMLLPEPAPTAATAADPEPISDPAETESDDSAQEPATESAQTVVE